MIAGQQIFHRPTFFKSEHRIYFSIQVWLFVFQFSHWFGLGHYDDNTGEPFSADAGHVMIEWKFNIHDA